MKKLWWVAMVVLMACSDVVPDDPDGGWALDPLDAGSDASAVSDASRDASPIPSDASMAPTEDTGAADARDPDAASCVPQSNPLLCDTSMFEPCTSDDGCSREGDRCVTYTRDGCQCDWDTREIVCGPDETCGQCEPEEIACRGDHECEGADQCKGGTCSPCIPTEGGVEVCDGIDNDCDGVIDVTIRDDGRYDGPEECFFEPLCTCKGGAVGRDKCFCVGGG